MLDFVHVLHERPVSSSHTTIPGKHRKSDAKKPNPGSRSTFTDYGEKEMISSTLDEKLKKGLFSNF